MNVFLFWLLILLTIFIGCFIAVTVSEFEKKKPGEPIKTREFEYDYFKCKSCDAFVGDEYITYKYCCNCGRKVDWQSYENKIKRT